MIKQIKFINCWGKEDETLESPMAFLQYSMGSEHGNSTGLNQHHHLTATPERESNFSSASSSK